MPKHALYLAGERMPRSKFKENIQFFLGHGYIAFVRSDHPNTEVGLGIFGGEFHCFSGSLAEAEQAIALGFKLGIGGVATFKNGGLDKILPHIGLDHLVLETDAPYLAPLPFRGKRNEPAYLRYIAGRLAELTGTTVDEVAAVTTQNALRVMGGK